MKIRNINTLKILKELISIPSWVDNKTNEVEIGNWIYEFLSNNSNLKVVKQDIRNGRFNILATNSNKIDVLVTGHIDTVQPNSGWTKNPINPEVVGNRLYGLGSTDMKSGLAIMLYLATLPNLVKGIGFLFYCDEEYDFLGMKAFIKQYKSIIKPKIIVSLDGEGLQIGNSCRGLIELKVNAIGRAGHAANLKSGINAITQSFEVINKLEKELSRYTSVELGNSTLNIAYMNGGSNQGNIIAEKCEYIVEVRVANEKLNAKLVKDFITKESTKLGLKINNIKTRHDLGSWVTKEKKLNGFGNFAPKKGFKSAKMSGYIDIQMLWRTFGKVLTFSIGAGALGVSHKADEYVLVSDIMKLEKYMEYLCTTVLVR